MTDVIEIPLSKTKMIALFAGALVFTVLGVLFVNSPETFVSIGMRNLTFIRVVGAISMVFFGLCLIVIARKLFDNRPGLIIDGHGITNNTGSFNTRVIAWNDIIGLKVEQIRSTRFLILYVSSPEKYIDAAKNTLIRQAIKMNNKMYGSPISITSTSLKIDFDDLEKLIRSELEMRNFQSAERSL